MQSMKTPQDISFAWPGMQERPRRFDVWRPEQFFGSLNINHCCATYKELPIIPGHTGRASEASARLLH